MELKFQQIQNQSQNPELEQFSEETKPNIKILIPMIQ